MRFSVASIAILAGAVAAVPQYSVQPISQISDGQIQAPPATSAVPAASEVPAYSSAVETVVPSVAPVPEVSSVMVTPSVVVPTATPIAPVPTLVTPVVPGVNSTMPTSTGAYVSSSPAASAESSVPAGSAASSSPSLPEASTGAAVGNMVSFGGLVFAIGAAVLA